MAFPSTQAKGEVMSHLYSWGWKPLVSQRGHIVSAMPLLWGREGLGILRVVETTSGTCYSLSWGVDGLGLVWSVRIVAIKQEMALLSLNWKVSSAGSANYWQYMKWVSCSNWGIFLKDSRNHGSELWTLCPSQVNYWCGFLKEKGKMLLKKCDKFLWGTWALLMLFYPCPEFIVAI